MIEFGGKNIGNPWHGLYKQSTGLIDTPSGVDVELFTGQTPFSGDCFLVALPGQPEPETSAIDALAGKTWLNYALISGRNRIFYGRTLGGAIIYVAPDRSTWRVAISTWGTRTEREIHISLSIQPFAGIVRQNAQWYPQITLTRSVSFSLGGVYDGANNENWLAEVVDVDKNGAAVLVAVPRQWGVAAAALLTLGGVPGVDFSASFVLLADEATEDVISGPGETVEEPVSLMMRREFSWGADPLPLRYEDGVPIYPSSPGIYDAADGTAFSFDGSSYAVEATFTMERHDGDAPTIEGNPWANPFGGLVSAVVDQRYSYDFSTSFLVGARFAAGAAELVHATYRNYRHASTFDYSASFIVRSVGSPAAALPAEYSETLISGVVATVSAGEKTAEAIAEVSVSGSGTFHIPSSPGLGGGFGGDYSGAATATGQASEPINFSLSPSDESREVTLAGPRALAGFSRISNSIFAPVLYRIDGNSFQFVDATTKVAGPFIGAVGDAVEFIAFDDGSGGAVHGTEHPVTGAVVVSGDGIVCWV